MITKLPSEYVRMLIRVARAEDGVDVTTLMHTFRQTPAVVAHFSRKLAAIGFLTVERSKLRATREGRDAAARFAAEQAARHSKSWRKVPSQRTKYALNPFEPYLPKRSEVDPDLLFQAGQKDV
ncbi:hypothetical protein [Phaeobacter piscinae]|uniref:hypothetical protein n=1 Tax=Phaeobacter piscinae TaxID=1580596 RepID=UPI0011AB7F0E|nr:hypothetical protein [Phaeobacter piscinae]